MTLVSIIETRARHSERVLSAFVVVALIASVQLASSAAQASDADRLKEAETIATEQNAATAIGAYKDLVTSGVDSDSVRYNLGTLYLEDGDAARAIFHLKTALLFNPLHADARHNLKTAVAMRTDSVSNVEEQGTTLIGIGRRIPRGATALAFGFLAFLLGLGLGLRALKLKLTSGRAMAVGVVVVAVMTLIAGSALGIRLYSEGVIDAVVLVDTTTARLGPSADAKESFEGHAGLVGAALEERDGYVRLRLDNGLEAWIRADVLGRVDGSDRLP